jgi:hypothetical protein
MPERVSKQTSERADTIEHRKGCPLCEHSDPDLELELQAWAQLLYDHFSSQQQPGHSNSTADVDIGRRSPTLKERPNKQPT